MKLDSLDCDVIVLGSGAAGLYAAWWAAAHGRVVLVTDGELASGSSYRAQGGIAAVTSDDDTFASHLGDTLAAGRGLCHRQAVDVLVREGAAAVNHLIAAGMPFDVDDIGALRRGLEGGHSTHRILHALGDRHIHRLAREIAVAALARRDSVGVHRRCDALADEPATGHSGRRARTAVLP